VIGLFARELLPVTPPPDDVHVAVKLVIRAPLPDGAVNFTFGGPERNVLLITADDAIWAAHLQATGPQP